MMIKRIDRMTDEEILEDALRVVPEYLAGIGKDGDFCMETCIRRCIGRVKYLYKKSASMFSLQNYPTSAQAMTAEQLDELTRLCVRLDAPLRQRIEPIRQRFLKRRAAYRINKVTASSLIPAAFKEAGLKAEVTGQQYRAKVEVPLPSGNLLRLYIRYKDLTKEGHIEEVVSAVTDLCDVLTRLGGAVSIK